MYNNSIAQNYLGKSLQLLLPSWLTAFLSITTCAVIIGVSVYYLYNRQEPVTHFFRFRRPKLSHLGSGLTFNIPHNELLPALLESFNEFKPIIQANIMGLPRIFITELDELACVFRRDPETSSNREVLVPWLGQSLLTDGCTSFTEGPANEGPYHGMINEYLKMANEHAAILVSQIQAEGNLDCVNINHKIYLCVLDIMCESGMGVNIKAQLGREPEFVKSVLALSQLIHKRQLLSWLLRPCVYNLTPTGREQNKLLTKVVKFSEKVILERFQVFKDAEDHEKPRNTENSKVSFLDLLIKNCTGMTVKELQEEVNNFIFSSHDKTSAAIIWAIFELGHNPDVQELAYLEQRDIFQDSTRAATADDLEKMTYLDRVIKETFRLYPSTPIISRRLKTDVTIRGYVIPAGTDIPIFIYYIHRNPELYPNPEQFNPNRFLPDRTLDLRRESYTPLIFGPRFSFVEEFAITKQKVILSQIIRNFKFVSLDKHKDLKLMGEFIIRPKNNLRISFQPRLKRETHIYKVISDLNHKESYKKRVIQRNLPNVTWGAVVLSNENISADIHYIHDITRCSLKMRALLQYWICMLANASILFKKAIAKLATSRNKS